MKSTIPNDSNFRKLRITSIRTEIDTVKSFTLETIDKAPFPYLPGQFLTFIFPGSDERRSYSFSSAPAFNEPMTVTLKRVENGKYSRPLVDHARAGDVLTVMKAAGQFVLPDHPGDYKQIFFFAAGIGITPVFSMIKMLLHNFPETEAVLIYSNRSQQDTVFYEELQELHKKYPGQLRLEFLISSSPNLSRARLSKWLLPQLLKDYSKAEKTKQLFYTCGPFAYMRMVMLSLEEQGYSREQMRKENFDTSIPVMKQLPPDTNAHEVRVRIKDRLIQFRTQYPQTILRAAKANGVVLPYSCETGRCGSCAALCIEGHVWMGYNEVLTDKDIKQGKTLTCTGYPVNGDVTLQF